MELDRTLSELGKSAENLDTGLKFNYANLLLSLNRFEAAIELYDQLNAGFPQWSCPWRHKGEAYLKLGKLGKAEEVTQISIDVREDHYDAYIQLAEVQKRLGKNITALASIEKAVSLMDKKAADEEITDQEVFQLYVEILRLNDQQNKADEIEQAYLR